MKRKTVGFLVVWFSFLALGMVVFTFLHECGHGFGAQLDGIHISTGFDRVGDFGKRPSDPDFPSNDMVTGELNSSGLFGPFTNWLFAIPFTVLILQRPKADRTTFLLGAGAVVNAWSRLWQMAAFFVAALLGRVHLEDEVGWGLRAIPRLHFPIQFNDFYQLTQTQPHCSYRSHAYISGPWYHSLLCLPVSFSHIVVCTGCSVRTCPRKQRGGFLD
jgi:hypothetical protein